MNSVTLMLLIGTAVALDCSLYDYSKTRVACALACPSGTAKINNYCLTPSQYVSNAQVFLCNGPVSTDRSVCCGQRQYLQGNTCLSCQGQVYSNGLACCPTDHYLDYSQGTTSCVQLQTGNCPSLLFSSPFKVCCPPQQLYNVAIGTCAGSFGLSCNASLGICCPNGQSLDYSQGGFICTGICSWKSSSGLLCQQKYCNSQSVSVLSGSQSPSSALMAFNGKCCYGLDNTSNCLSDPNACLSSFANRGWSICCGNGQFYTISTGACTAECGIGYVLLGFFCVTQGKGVDLRGMLGQPIEMGLSADCNGITLPPQLPLCCPVGFYVKDNSGCTLCNGNIFLNIDSQVCCPHGHYFNVTSGECTFCSGTMDASMQICCQMGTYVRYDSSGIPQCSPTCSTDNQYMSNSCCDGLSAGCSNIYSPSTCSTAYFLPNSCKGCPGFCAPNGQACIGGFSSNACTQSCRPSEVSTPAGCLKCDPSCATCTTPMSSSACVSCAEGYTMLGKTCQACGLGCRTCYGATDLCTSCFREAGYTLIGGKCYGRCSNSGYYLDPLLLSCRPCNAPCAECTSSPSNCTMCQSPSYRSGGQCQSCSPSCSTCFATASTCITCSNNYFMTSDRSCVGQCPDVVYKALPSNPWCLSCHPDCQGCVSHPQNCMACASDSTYLDGSLGVNVCTPCQSPCRTCITLSECLSCVDGSYLQGGNCVKCDQSCHTCNGPSNSNCLSCFGTSSLSPDGFCSGCSSSCKLCSGSLCKGCTEGYFLFNGNCVTVCPAGTFANGSSCTACDSSCAGCNATSCLTCSGGYLYILGSKCMNSCPAGYAATQGTCIKTATTNYTNNNGNNNGNDNNPNNNSGNNNNNTPNPVPTTNDSHTTLTQVGSIVDQTVIVQGRTAYINIYFNSTDILSNSISVNLVNRNNGDVIPLSPSPKDVTDNRISFAVTLPEGSDLTQYSLIQTTSTAPGGTTSTLLSSQSSNQFLLNDLQSNAFSNMKVLSYIFSSVVLLYALLSKTKGHFTAEEANNIILHSVNFAQVCYLFKFTTTLTEGGYFFLNGFGIASLTFFPNFFPPPDYYVETPVEKSLVPDGNLLRNAGSSISYQLIVMGVFLVAVIASFLYQKGKGLEQPPQIRKIMRLGSFLLGLGFTNELFFSFVQLLQPAAVAADHASFHNTSLSLSIALAVVVPVIMAAVIFHFYHTYNSDVLQHYYTLREASHYLLGYAQALVMAVGVGKPLVGLFLIALEGMWFVFNFLLYRYGTGAKLSGYKKYWGVSGAVSMGYLFLAVEWGVGWVAMVVIVSLVMVVLLVYCTYQVVGIYYYNIFTKPKDNPKEKRHQ